MLGFKHVKAISVPNKSSMSFRFAKLEDKTEEELILDAEARRADCSRGGRNAQKIRKELNGLTQKLVNAKSSTAQDRALSNLVEAIEISPSGKKRGESLRAGLLGLIAHINKLDSDLVQTLSSALDVNPIIPKMTYESGRAPHINSVTKQPGAKRYLDGRAPHPTYETDRAPHPTYETGRAIQKQSINSVTLKHGAKKKEDGRLPGTGRNAHSDKLEIAVQAKLDDPNLTVPQALRKGGFVFNVPDSELTAKSMVIEKTSSKTCKTLWGNFRSMKTRMMKDYGQ